MTSHGIRRWSKTHKIWASTSGLLVILAIAILLLGVTGGRKTKSSDNAPTNPNAINELDKGIAENLRQAENQTKTTQTYPHFGDGTYIVGQDIQPGTYRTRVAPNTDCYYARLNSLNTSDILANNNTFAPAVITINSSDKAFISQGCGSWTQDLSAITTTKTSFSDGIYIIGTDIEPGTYHTNGQTGCYWARLRDFSGGGTNIIDNGNSNGLVSVTILSTDKGFSADHCGTWIKQ